MADVTKTVEIIFGAKNDVSKTVDDITQKFSDFSDLTSKITAPLASVGDSILKVDAALTALAIGGLALAIKESANFNKAFALISTSVTATGGDLAKYRDDVLLYSTTSVKSLEDINASLYTAAQAGIKYTDSIAFMGKVEQLAVANNANLNTTVDLLTGTMNAYGFTIKDVGHLNDVFFQSTLIGKQTIDDLGASMGLVVAIAANSGVSFEELSAAIATLTAKGMTTTEAITAVKGVITTIIAPSKEAADAAKNLGLNFSLTELSSKGLAVMLQEIMTKTGGSKEATVGLFNEMRAMNGILQLTGDGGKFFNEALQQIIHSSGAAEAAYKKMVETFGNQSQMVINVARGLFIDVGTKLEPVAGEIAKGLSVIFAGIKIGVDAGAFDPLFAALGEAGHAFSTWLNGVAKAMPEALGQLDFSGLIAAFKGLGEAFGAYFGNLDLTKTDDLAKALQTIIDIITGLIHITAGMAEAFRPFISQIADFFLAMSTGGPEVEKTIGQVLAFAKAIEMSSLALVAALIAMQEFGVNIKSTVDGTMAVIKILFNFLTLGIEGVQYVFEEVAFAVVDILDKMTMGLIPQLTTAKENIRATLSNLTMGVRTDVNDAKDGFAKLGDAIRGVIPPIDAAAKSQEAWSRKVSDAKTVYVQAGDTMESLGAKIAVMVGHADNATGSTEKLGGAIAKIPDNKEVTIQVLADGTQIETTKNMIYKYFPDGEVLITNIGTKVDEANLAASKAKVAEAVPAAKVMEIQAKIDEVRLKETSDIVQKSIEWSAKIDIAQIEASATIIKATFASIDNTITSTGTAINSMIGDYVKAYQTGGSNLIEDQIRKESQRRDEALTLQTTMTLAQVALIKQQTESLKAGNALIQIDGKGLQPHLEAFMFEILSAIQIKANAEGMKFLVGV
jgi:TP901 family phage tail tape measure protein